MSNILHKKKTKWKKKFIKPVPWWSLPRARWIPRQHFSDNWLNLDVCQPTELELVSGIVHKDLEQFKIKN